jgi:hypothetical protein
MRAWSFVISMAALSAAVPLPAQEPGGAVAARAQARAVAVEGRAPVIDGRLSEEGWGKAPPVVDFVQREPAEGAPGTERTEVRFLYGPDALYVGARMYSRDPRAIQAPVSRRDQGAQAERLLVSLDPYRDRLTAYTFGVTAAGTRLDAYHPADREESTDQSFDPVWEAEVRTDSLGWTAEMRIPYSQLRFHRAEAQVWGLNLRRSIPSRNEDAYWVLVPKKETGWASRFGELVGIEGIRPTRRVELRPYFSSGATLTGRPEEGNPFHDGSTLSARAGGELKMGLGPNLTLEGTVNPDFGQVEADPAVVNLSAFETFVTERRPFFIEGSQLLRGGGAAYLHTWRIGSVPRVSVSGDHVDFPQSTRILGAAKLTGRLPSGTSLGVLGAATDAASARTWDRETGRFGRLPVAPLTGYAALRAQQEVGASASRVGLTLTGVRRDVAPGEPLAAMLSRQALAGGADWNLRFRGGAYEVGGWVGLGYVGGEPEAILRAQRSSTRYFQRPDAGHVRVDSSRTSLLGYTGAFFAARNRGRWLWNLGVVGYSPRFEMNDAGAFRLADNVFGFGDLRYRQTKPGPVFHSYEIRAGTAYNFNFGGTRTYTSFDAGTRVTWKNFWSTRVNATFELPSRKDRLTWGGPLVGIGRRSGVEVSLQNSAASPTRLGGSLSYRWGELGEAGLALSAEGSLRPHPRWQLSLEPSYSRSTDPRQYVTTRSGGPGETFGHRYVFSSIDRTEVAARLRLGYLFTPDLTLELYAEPFASSGRYYRFGELPRAGSRRLRLYGSEGTTAERQPDGSLKVSAPSDTFTLPYRDFNVRSFRSNTVLRWEWRPGSTLYVVWQQDRSARERRGDPVGPGSVWGAFSAPGENRLMVKLTYWIPVK